jgi:two-component sensor histidine kinase
MGLQLVGLLAKQLDAFIEMKVDKGTSVSLVYPQETASPDNSPGRPVALANA